MSSSRNLSVKKLRSKLLKKQSMDEKGEKWISKSSSLPNLANDSKTCAFSDTSGNGNSLAIDHGGKNQKSFILRNLQLKSLSKHCSFDKKSYRPKKSNQNDGSISVLSRHENEYEYDRNPGSVSSSEKDGEHGTERNSTPTKKEPPINNCSKHQFSFSRIGYISPKKRSKNRILALEDSFADDIDNVDYVDCTAELPRPNVGPSVCENGAVERTGAVNNRNNTLTVEPDKSDIEAQETQCPVDRPPARPPKPLELRGEPLNYRSQVGLGTLETDHPPRPPERQPMRRNFPTNRAVQLLWGNRESGAYEAIDDKPAFVQEFGLPGELRKLPHQPWYWGPLTQEQAEGKLRGLPDGYFLVRDSSDERYLLSLSFNSNGRPVHTRFEYVNGHFSINDSQGYLSVVDLIEEAVRESQNGVYSFMQNINGTQTFPARLTNPVSRFTEMKSLQHLCRFVIRETFPRHYVADLPVPDKIKKYILENQY